MNIVKINAKMQKVDMFTNGIVGGGHAPGTSQVVDGLVRIMARSFMENVRVLDMPTGGAGAHRKRCFKCFKDATLECEEVGRFSAVTSQVGLERDCDDRSKKTFSVVTILEFAEVKGCCG